MKEHDHPVNVVDHFLEDYSLDKLDEFIHAFVAHFMHKTDELSELAYEQIAKNTTGG